MGSDRRHGPQSLLLMNHVASLCQFRFPAIASVTLVGGGGGGGWKAVARKVRGHQSAYVMPLLFLCDDTNLLHVMELCK